MLMKNIIYLFLLVSSFSFSQITDLEVLVNRNDTVSLKKKLDAGLNVDTTLKEDKTLLSIACENGKLPMVRFLLNQGANIEHEASFDAKPIYYAAKGNHFDIVKYLVDRGASTNLGFFNLSPVEEAAGNGNLEMVKFLVEKGYAQQGAVSKAQGSNVYDIVKYLVEHGGNPTNGIISASETGNFKLVKYLVEKGADISVSEKRRKGFLKGKYSVTPFERAVNNNHSEVAIYLLKQGLDKDECFEIAYIDKANQSISDEVLAQMNDYNKAIFLPILKDDIMLLKFMLNKKAETLNARDDKGNSILHAAIKSKAVSIVNYLCENGTLLNIENNEKVSPIQFAASTGNKEIYSKLYIAKSNTKTKDANGNYLLHHVSIGGNSEILSIVLAEKEDVNTINNLGQTPLMLAVENGDINFIRILLAQEIDISKQDIEGSTVLHYASKFGKTDIVNLLLEKGMDPLQKNKLQETAVSLATRNNHFKLIQLYDQKGMTDLSVKNEQGYTPMMNAIKECNFEKIKKLHTMGAKIENVTPDGKAIECKNEQILRYIIENGGEINNKTDSFEETYLYKAIKDNNQSLAKFLLENNANPNISNTFSEPPLYQAITDNDLNMVKLLVEFKANVNQYTGWKDKNILSHAISKGNQDIINYLIEKGAVKPGEIIKPSIEQLSKENLLEGIQNDNIKLVDDIIKANKKLSFSDAEITEVVEFIFKNKHSGLLVYLVQTKALPTSYRDNLNGETLLIKSVKTSFPHSSLEILLRAGADINEVDKKKRTSVMYAAENYDLPTLKYLAELGADINLEDMYGKKAIDLGDKAIEKYLKSIKQ